MIQFEQMRADRLVSILMLLQSRGRTSARELSETLDVSVRTIYRDVDALCAAGIPVYAEHGAEGGYALVENYRTELTGMTGDEIQALVLLAVPGPLEGLEVGQKLKAALRKLYAALPKTSSAAPRRIHLDWSGWRTSPAPGSLLETLYRAVQEGRRVRLTYLAPNLMKIEQKVEPLGLVSKAGTWHVVWAVNGKARHQRISDVLEARLTEERFPAPEGFDLEDYWKGVCAETEVEARRFKTLVRLDPAILSSIQRQAGACSQVERDPSDPPGWVRLELSFEMLEIARQRLLGYGRAVEVLAPEELRLSIADYARQTAALYGERREEGNKATGQLGNKAPRQLGN